MKKLFFIFLLVFICISLYAQDIHFSQFYYSPLEMNPARTGLINGDQRFTGIYRNQWNSVSIPYVSSAFSFDLKNKKNFGAGISVLNDKAGDGELNTLKAGLSLSYFFDINDSADFISIGIKNSIVQTSIDYSKFTFDKQYNGDIFVPGSPTGENFGSERFFYYDLSAGINWHHITDEENYISAGTGFFHLNKPVRSFIEESSEKLKSRIALMGNGRFRLSEKLALLPAAEFMIQGPFNELVFGSNVRLNILEKPGSPAFYIGGWMRMQDAFIVSTGMDYQNWLLGLAYDFNISGLKPASNGNGGFEIALHYIITKVRPVNPHGIACPVY
jgi:type IX secretion system PorP/SprF family membrane protein